MSNDSPHTRDFFGLTLLLGSHPAVRRLRKSSPQHSHHGNKLWKASALLVDYLAEFPPAHNSRILEIGAGWGLAGIYCAKHWAADVTALDIDEAVFPVLALQASHNDVRLTPRIQSLETLTASDLNEFDMLIASDICFWDDLSRPVASLLQLASSLGIRVVVSDPGRPPFIAAVDTLAENLEEPSRSQMILENWSVPHPYNCGGLILELPAGES